MPSKKHATILLFIVLAAIHLSAATVQDAMKCAVVPNANAKLYLDKRMVKDLYQAARNFLSILMATNPDIPKEDAAKVQLALGLVDMLGIQDIQFSAALAEKSACLAVATAAPVNLQPIQTLIQQIDAKKQLGIAPVDSNAFTLLGGAVQVRTVADGHLLLVMSAPAVPQVTASIAANKPYRFPADQVKGIREDGFFHLALNNIAEIRPFLGKLGIWQGPWPVSATICEYIDGTEQHLATRIHCTSAEDAQNIRQQLLSAFSNASYLNGLLPTVTGCDLVMDNAVPVERSMLTGGVSPFVPVAAAMLLPALSKARHKAQGISCMNNLKQLSLGLVMYTYDHENAYPAPENWFKELMPYLGDEKLAVCKTSGKHYLYHGKAIKGSALKHPSKTIAFTCQDPHEGKINIAFADGHVESVTANSLQEALDKNPIFVLLKDVK